MKRYNYILLLFGLLTLGFSSCEMRDELKKLPAKAEGEKEGWMTLAMASNDKMEHVISKAVFDANDVDPTLYPVKIINTITDEVVARYDSYGDLLAKGQIRLTAGKYKVIAYNYDGSEVNASERPYFQGMTEFEILPGKTTKVNTTCKLQNVAVTIGFSNDFSRQFKDDYAITITNGEGGVKVFNRDYVGKTFYFKVPDQKNSVQLTIKATTTKNEVIVENRTVIKPVDAGGSSNLASGDEFTVNIGTGDTQMRLDVSVDLTMHETGVTIEIPTENIVFNGSSTPGGGEEPEPEPGEEGITVTGLNETYTISMSEIEGGTKPPTVQVSIKTSNGISELGVQISSDNDNFMSTLTTFGLNVPFDLANPGDLLGVLSGSLEDFEGIGLIDANDPIKGKTEYLFDITDFMSLLPAYDVGHYEFSITVKDGKSEPVEGILTIDVTK